MSFHGKRQVQLPKSQSKHVKHSLWINRLLRETLTLVPAYTLHGMQRIAVSQCGLFHDTFVHATDYKFHVKERIDQLTKDGKWLGSMRDLITRGTRF